jgi:hypothetical protein
MVSNLAPSTSGGIVQMYFENGGAKVGSVEMNSEEGRCLVFFEDPEGMCVMKTFDLLLLL